MFSFFKETKIVAEAFTDGRWNIMQYTGIDIEKMKGMEKSDLMDGLLELLKNLPDRTYSSTQMVIATWEATIEFANKQTLNSGHPLAGKAQDLEAGLILFRSSSGGVL